MQKWRVAPELPATVACGRGHRGPVLLEPYVFAAEKSLAHPLKEGIGGRCAMKTIIRISIVGSMIVSLACGVASERDGPVARASSAILYFDPIGIAPLYRDLVGRGLNGRSWEGLILDGRMVLGVSLKQVAFPHRPPRNLRLEATVFRGAPGPKGVIGAIFQATLDNGTSVPLTITGLEPRGEPGRSFFVYEVRFLADGQWQPLCGSDESGRPVAAIPLNGRWDYREGSPTGGDHLEDGDTFTFACEDRVLAKCVRMGYAPWQQGFLCRTDAKGKKACQKTTLAAMHQACTRALRADYCGDGVSYTEDGMWTLVRDGIGIRDDIEDWAFEAEWDEHGARCLAHDRLGILEGIPCGESLRAPDCGDPAHFEAGTLVMTEVPPEGGGE